MFRSGFVLPRITTRGEVLKDEQMSHKDFVKHLRASLVHIGLPEEEAAEYAGQSLRAGGATSAALSGLSSAEIAHLAGVKDVNWPTYYNRNHLSSRLRASRALGL